MISIERINEYIKENVDNHNSVKKVSDTHHTFEDYIEMRNELFVLGTINF